jgi:eukaryotic-like serine/threonine-protein kinase
MAVEQMLIAGRYLLRESVGSGGMGRVWLARDELLRRDVAIKEVIPPHWLTDDERIHLRELTLREAQAAARLNHPHVVKIYDVVQTELWPWIVMEYVPSRSLQSVLEQEGPLPPVRVAEIGLSVLDALRAAHRAGVLHRDVKPHNVLIGDDGRVVLTDFGLATLDTDGAVTRPGLVATPQYLAPERARRGISTEAADIWSLGATLYAAVEGRTPYARPTIVETLTALATEPPDPMRQAGSLKPVIEGLLRRDPEIRLRPIEAERMLRKAAVGTAVEPKRTERAERQPSPHRRIWMRAGLTAAAVLAAVAVAVVAANRDNAGDQTGTPPYTDPSTVIIKATGVMNCERTPASAALIEPRTGPMGEPYQLMDGYAWYGHPGSWYVGIQKDWQTWKVGDITCFGDARGGRIVAVDAGRPASNDPVAAGQSEEKRLRDAGQLPGYHLVNLHRRDINVAAAEWEFTFRSAGVLRHALALIAEDQGQTFVVYWATDDSDFAASRFYWEEIVASFRTGPPDRNGPPPDEDGPPPFNTASPPPFRSPPPRH